MKTLPLRKQGFTLIEILIVITIIGILAALAAGALGAFGGGKSRDAVRISDVQQLATIVGSLQNRFHVPPLAKITKSRYPAKCKEGQQLEGCLRDLKVMSETELYEIMTDPKQGIDLNGKPFEYYYAASPDGFKVCARMEDQGAFENINANESGQIVEVSTLTPSDTSSYMHCVVQGKGVNNLTTNAIVVTDPKISE